MKQNRKTTLTSVLISFIAIVWLTTMSVFAVNLWQQIKTTKKQIPLAKIAIDFKVENDSNHFAGKELLDVTTPAEDNFVHVYEVKDVATLSVKGLKTFPNKAFVKVIKAGLESNKPIQGNFTRVISHENKDYGVGDCFSLKNGRVNITHKIQQLQPVPEETTLFLIVEYELTDKDGNPFQSGQILTTKTAITAQ